MPHAIVTPGRIMLTAASALLVAPAFLAGCSSSNRPPSQAQVVEVEAVELVNPAGPSTAATPAAAIITDAEAATRKVDRATEAADRAIKEAGSTIPSSQSADAIIAEAEGSRREPAKPAVGNPAAANEKPPLVKPTSDARSQQRPEKVELGDPALTSGVPGSGPITLADIDAWLADPKNFRLIEPVLPLGLSQGAGQVAGLDANPLTRAKIELGRQLYFDTRLSVDSTVSCASCHDPATGYTAHTKTGIGIRGQAGGRNSPVSFNRILSAAQFWDGRADSLEAQAIGPIQNPIEMGFTHEGVVKRLGEIPVYRKQFESIFGELTIERVGQAIAAFERSIVTAPSAYDYAEQLRPFAALDEDDIADDPDLAKRYAAAKSAAEAHPMSESAKRGREIFFSEKGNCTACHVGANLADEKFHNLGIGMEKPEPDVGRFAVTKDDKDRGAFKTPTVRNVALTAPYMHDGSIATLEEVVEWYDRGGHPNPNLSDKIRPLKLSAQDKADLVAFMQACTSPTPAVQVGRLPADP